MRKQLAPMARTRTSWIAWKLEEVCVVWCGVMGVVYIGSRVGRWWRSERPGDDDRAWEAAWRDGRLTVQLAFHSNA